MEKILTQGLRLAQGMGGLASPPELGAPKGSSDKDTKDVFRCPWCGERYKRWAEKSSTASPGYFLMLYGPGQETFYIRAVPPSTEQDNLLNLVKLLMNPKDILSLFRHAYQIGKFDECINSFCNEEFAECASYCKQAIIRLEKVGDFTPDLRWLLRDLCLRTRDPGDRRGESPHLQRVLFFG